MRTIRITFLLFIFGFLRTAAWSSDAIVSIRVIPPSETVHVGETAEFNVELDIHKPYHINANRPLEDYLIPTLLELQPVPGFEITAIRYPVAEVKQLPFSDTPMAVYEGVVHVLVQVKPTAALEQTNAVLQGTVRYQACNDSTCLPEASQPFSIALSSLNTAIAQTEASSGSPGTPVAPDEPENAAPESSGPAAESASGPDWLHFGENSLAVMLLLVFLGGLALDLTPCIYPMIPITITYFGGQAHGRKGNLIAHSCLYIIGMAVTYSLLGVAAALTGGILGAALQYPPVLIAIALVMVLLALSMFEVYELRMPGFLNRMAGGNRSGFAGTFLMGMTVGIVAAPCIGPFVFGLLTYVGNSGNAFLGFLLFFVLSIGMGIPLLVLGIFSGSIHRLPRSGEWMVWVRKVFGFILLAMALFFLKTLLPPLAYPLAFGMLLTLAGIYLAWIAPVSGAGRGFAWLRQIVGIGFFIAALVATVSGLNSYLDNFSGNEGAAQSAGAGSGSAAAIDWLPFSEQAVAKAAREGKPVLMDFYADWCAPCKEFDKQTFVDPSIVDLSRRFVMVKVDLTKAGDSDVEALQKRYRISGVPTLIFLQPDGSEIPDLRTVGFKPADAFRPRMEKAYRMSSGGSQVPREEATDSPS
jgi:thiol:disulfide interchange protein DsbD